ncbi:N-acetyl-gamma-glutamyl-phosphate reductase [Wenzhouxiangella sp. XN79A]|uniref:N-acetyl-gamma-glutamyl-phosphate reductase n=1 Tax=Wenzhouxiangella sp. XN79A TaxID=2724193 RepID=UPI00144AB07E|nr:N-acetyl-gamma-glutamyl-phosphate reductase [Wenzhouxiangella sp. XN79A]NKI35253.1 N-acetyl-gamma-glutamyl-phosphate reductase [Wenzhouxiangella sp. XN79A]
MSKEHHHRLALIGARGYTGRELLERVMRHPAIELALAASGAQAGRPIRDEVPDWPDAEQVFVALAPDEVAGVEADLWALAVPNGASGPWVAAIEAAHPDAIIIDFGADYRFDPDWVYGLTEFNRSALAGARRISNPGCYATGAQFGLLPLRERLAAPPVVFGVSGYSGAGRTPSPRNDPERLADNLIPYALTGHVHEREISAHLGRPVRFCPHVASFFRGISLTIAATLTEPVTAEALQQDFEAVYGDEALVAVTAAIPELRDLVAGRDLPRAGLAVGGFAVDERDGHRASFVVVLDNLLKGAAGQALQNLNVALGLDERLGLEDLA